MMDRQSYGKKERHRCIEIIFIISYRQRSVARFMLSNLANVSSSSAKAKHCVIYHFGLNFNQNSLRTQ